MREELLKNQYIFYVNRDCDKKRLYGTYIKGTKLRIDDLIEASNQELAIFKNLPNLLSSLEEGKYFTMFFDLDNREFIGEVRKETYQGPYNEERYQEVISHSKKHTISDVLFDLETKKINEEFHTNIPRKKSVKSLLRKNNF